MKILSGTSNLRLSKNIAKNLKLKLINTNIEDLLTVKSTLRLTKILGEIVYLLFSQHLILLMII